ncbi:MAG: MBG domain-containing protein, partial [Opitutaceae bacterium]
MKNASQALRMLALVGLTLAGATAVMADGWNTAPPATTAVGSLVVVNETATYPAGTPPTYIHTWIRNPSGTWIRISIAGGTPGTQGTMGYSYTLNAQGTWTWEVTGETSIVSTPGGNIRVGPTNTVAQTPVTFNFSGGPTFTYDGTAKSVTATTTPSGGTFSQTGTWSATNVGSYTATATANGNYTGTGSYNWSIAAAST